MKVTASGRLCPALSVVTPVKPLTAKGAAVCTLLTVIAVLPALLTLTAWAPLVVLMIWSPKLNAVGETFRTGVTVAPVPDSAIMVGGLVALLATLTLPVTLPEEAGAKATLRVAV